METVRREFGGSLTCSFCGKSQNDVKQLLAGPGVYICDECLWLLNDIMVEEGLEWPWRGSPKDAPGVSS